MPTKPANQPEAWATNANYTTGPFIGSPSKVVPGAAVATEGHRPGALFPTAAEHENSQQNRITALARWLFLGTYNPDPDAHVVETDSTGRAGLHGLDVTDTADEIAVNISGANTVVPTVLVTCTTGAAAVQADIGTSAGTCFAAATGTGAATGFKSDMVASPAGARGMQITADAATAGPGARIAHAGTGASLEIVDTGNKASAVVITTANNTRALLATGSGSGLGILAFGGTTAGANAIQGTANNATGFGVVGTTSAAATSAARGVRANGQNAGIGLEATAVTGEAIHASASDPNGAAFYLPGKAGYPTNLFNGRLDRNSTANTWCVSSSSDLAYRDLRSSLGNACHGGTTANVATTAGAAVWVTAATFTLQNGEAPMRIGRTLRLRFRCEARMTLAVTGTLNVRIRVTAPAAATLATRAGAGAGAGAGYYLGHAVTDWQRPVILDVDYAIAATGLHTFVAEIQTATADNVQVRDAALLPEGLF